MEELREFRSNYETLFMSPKIEVRKSPIHGYGIFAKEAIDEHELIEEDPSAPVIKKAMLDYCYTVNGFQSEEIALMPLGRGSVYNSSQNQEEANAAWVVDMKSNIFIFKATKNIKKDEEILIYYGDGWWEARPETNFKEKK